MLKHSVNPGAVMSKGLGEKSTPDGSNTDTRLERVIALVVVKSIVHGRALENNMGFAARWVCDLTYTPSCLV